MNTNRKVLLKDQYYSDTMLKLKKKIFKERKKRKENLGFLLINSLEKNIQ